MDQFQDVIIAPKRDIFREMVMAVCDAVITVSEKYTVVPSDVICTPYEKD